MHSSTRVALASFAPPGLESKRNQPNQQKGREHKTDDHYHLMVELTPKKPTTEAASEDSPPDESESAGSWCSPAWLKDYRDVMTPTKKWFDWSNSLWVKDKTYRGGHRYVRDRRDQNGCLKIVDGVGCKFPIVVFGMFNCCVASAYATVNNLECNNSNGPARVEMK